ncbi:TPA: hypothetical protein DCZ39_09180 [Patescibacteria group bacterium]|nr:hypothetical protein [Candidatus Gracilibacteria bacterium]
MRTGAHAGDSKFLFFFFFFYFLFFFSFFCFYFFFFLLFKYQILEDIVPDISSGIFMFSGRICFTHHFST